MNALIQENLTRTVDAGEDYRKAGEYILRAAQLFESHLAERNVYLSTEVLQEFFVAITQKLARVPVRTAKELVSAYARLHVVTVGTGHILKAIGYKSRYRVSFRDALILAARGARTPRSSTARISATGSATTACGW